LPQWPRRFRRAWKFAESCAVVTTVVVVVTFWAKVDFWCLNGPANAMLAVLPNTTAAAKNKKEVFKLESFQVIKVGGCQP
jgi:hypothetical protein